MAFPLFALAASLAPGIIRPVAGDRTGALAGEVTRAVREAAGTEDPTAAHAALAADPPRAEALRLRLTEIALDGERLAAEREAGQRGAALEALRAGLSGMRAAPAGLAASLQGAGRPAWGPATISSLVVIGFFAVLVLLVTLDAAPGGARFDPQVASVINITVGSLGAAFAAVVNFWIGSSQSSRDKDSIVGRLQEAQAQQVRAALETLRAPAPAEPLPLLRPPARGAEDRFEACLDHVLAAEGGFVNHPSDPGGATNMGITLRTLSEFREEEATEEDIRSLTRDEAREIYRARYWNPMRCGEMPAGIDLTAFDFGVNAGPGRSIRMLQRCAGAAADGSVGPVTLAALRARGAAAVIGRMAEARGAYYRDLPTFPVFGRGWLRRVEAVRRASLAMAGEAGGTSLAA